VEALAYSLTQIPADLAFGTATLEPDFFNAIPQTAAPILTLLEDLIASKKEFLEMEFAQTTSTAIMLLDALLLLTVPLDKFVPPTHVVVMDFALPLAIKENETIPV